MVNKQRELSPRQEETKLAMLKAMVDSTPDASETYPSQLTDETFSDVDYELLDKFGQGCNLPEIKYHQTIKYHRFSVTSPITIPGESPCDLTQTLTIYNDKQILNWHISDRYPSVCLYKHGNLFTDQERRQSYEITHMNYVMEYHPDYGEVSILHPISPDDHAIILSLNIFTQDLTVERYDNNNTPPHMGNSN